LGWHGHACVKNLSCVGGEVCTKFDGDWSGGSGVKRGHRYIGTNSLFYIYRLSKEKSFVNEIVSRRGWHGLMVIASGWGSEGWGSNPDTSGNLDFLKPHQI